MTEADALRYAALFGAHGTAAAELEGGFSNESWRVRGDAAGDVVARRYGRLHVTRNAVFYEHAFVRHLASRIATVRAPLLDPDGESFRLEDGAFVAALPWIDGRTGDLGAYEAAAGALAALHRAAGGFRASRPRATRTLGTLGWLRQRFVRFAGEPALARALDWTAAIVAVASAAASVSPRTAGLPIGTVHGDPHPDNVVTAGGEVRGVIDFDFAHETERAYDVATAADAYARADEDAPLDVARFAAFVRAYDAAAPLAPGELACLRDMAIRRNATLVWYLAVRHGARAAGDVGRAARYVERLRELARLAPAELTRAR